jgi:hypothetical protein
MAEGGFFTLPAAITDAYAVARCLIDERAKSGVDLVGPARRRLHEATFDAANGRGGWPTGEEVVQAELAQQAVDVRVGALDAALEVARDHFASTVQEMADVVVSDYLRPRFDKVLADTLPAATAVADFGGDLAAIIGAPKATRDAWLALDGLVRSYQTLRRARTTAYAGRTPKLDVQGVFSEMRNLPDIWPSWRQQVDPPGPTDPKARLCWLVTGPAEPWLPTLAQQDERYEERFATELENARRSRLIAAGGVHAGV